MLTEMAAENLVTEAAEKPEDLVMEDVVEEMAVLQVEEMTEVGVDMIRIRQ